jgi:DNA topoisomerase-3
LRDLVNNGITGVIKGFVSKGGKRFDAKLKLNKDESGKITGIGFDFG